MRAVALTIVILPILMASSALAGEASFRAKPTAARDGGKVKIAFAVSAPIDVEVAVINAEGKVVRSLAAGVLGGTNPPPEPLKPGPAQEIVWDGKGDWNLPIGSGPFKVRVRLGMGAKFGRLIGDSPYNFYEMGCRGLAVDPKNGDLYVLAKRGRDGCLYSLRVYDRTGKYLREIMPYPATVDAQSRQVYGSLLAPGMEAPAPLNRMSIWPVFYPMISRYAVEKDSPSAMAVKLIGIHPTEQDTLLLLDEYFGSIWRIRKSDGGAGSPFEEALLDASQKPDTYGANGSIEGAVSPDGKALYFAGYCNIARKGQRLHPRFPEGRVHKMERGGKAKPFADVALPEGWPPAEGAWAGPFNGVQALHGVAVDKDGNVLVCDTAGGKVRVFSTDGKELGAIDAPGAFVAVPDRKTGALYVLTRARLRQRKLGATDALMKYESGKPGAARVAVLSLKGDGASLAGDFSGPTPQLWLAGCPRPESLLRIEEKDGKLEIAEDLADRGKTAAGFAIRIDVDPEADLVYINNGWGQTRRYDGITGEYAGKLAKNGLPDPLIGGEFCVRRDGMVYLSGSDYNGGGWAGPWRRFSRDLTPAPLPDGRKEFSNRYGKMGGGYFGNQGACVTPDGRIYCNAMFWWRLNAIFEVNADGSPGRCPRLREIFSSQKSTVYKQCFDGGFTGAFIGWLQDQSGGVAVDQKGHVYAGIRIFPRGYVPPGDLAKFSGMIGSVVKFAPEGGGMLPDPQECKPGAVYKFHKLPSMTMPEKIGPGLPMDQGGHISWEDTHWKKYIEGGVAAYPLLAPFSASCACQTPRFDVDDYGRLYIPNALACSVQVVDNAGNEILRFGGYGNFDSQGPESGFPKPAIPLAYPCAAKASFRHIYAADSANRRVVRIDPTWAAEETCEVR